MKNLTTTQRISILAALALLAAGLFLGKAFLYPFAIDLFSKAGWQGLAGQILFILAYAAGIILLVPGMIPAMCAGAIFGVWKGAAIVSIASCTGAVCSFLLGRYLLRDITVEKAAGNRRFAALDNAISAHGWKIVLLARLSPLFPFNLFNYFFGITSISLRSYAISTFAGMLPGTIVYAYMGALSGDAAEIIYGPHPHLITKWPVLGITAIATLIILKLAATAASKNMVDKIRNETRTTALEPSTEQ